MSIRNTVIMLLLCLSLGAFWYIHDYKGAAERQEAETQTNRVFADLKADDIQGLRWTQSVGLDGGERILKYDKGLWFLTIDDKSNCVASLSHAQQLASSLATLTRASVILEEPTDSDYAEYSLDKPYGELEVTYAVNGKGTQTKTLIVGAETPAGDARYMRLKDQKAVLEVPADCLQFLQSRYVDMRERSLLVVSPEKVTSLAMHQPGEADIILNKVIKDNAADALPETDSLVTSSKDKWMIDLPHAERADASVVSDYLWKLHSMQVTEFVPMIPREQLGELQASWDVTVGSEQKLSVEIWASAEMLKRGEVYACRPDTKECMVVKFEDDLKKDASKRPFPKLTTDFIDHHVLANNVDDISRMEISIPSRTVNGKTEPALNIDVRKIRDGWEVRQPAQTIRDESKRDAAIFEIAYAMVDMQWKDRLQAGGSKPQSGGPVATIYGEKDKVLAQVLVGEKAPNSAGYYLLLEGEDEIFVLEKDPSLAWAKSIRTVTGADKKDVASTDTEVKADGDKPAVNASENNGVKSGAGNAQTENAKVPVPQPGTPQAEGMREDGPKVEETPKPPTEPNPVNDVAAKAAAQAVTQATQPR